MTTKRIDQLLHVSKQHKKDAIEIFEGLYDMLTNSLAAAEAELGSGIYTKHDTKRRASETNSLGSLLKELPIILPKDTLSTILKHIIRLKALLDVLESVVKFQTEENLELLKLSREFLDENRSTPKEPPLSSGEVS
jgi:hypothetical protein